MKFKPGAISFSLISVALLLSTTGSARAQLLAENLEWKESEVPAPPAFDVSKLLTFEVSRASSLVYGVDPATVSISRGDSLVRYVVVATSATGVRNVFYEGIRCSTGEFKTYARYLPEGRWQPVANAEWRSVFGSMPSKHALGFAKAGACDSAAPVGSVRELRDKLKNSSRYLDQ